jgi:hypothetical protein
MWIWNQILDYVFSSNGNKFLYFLFLLNKIVVRVICFHILKPYFYFTFCVAADAAESLSLIIEQTSRNSFRWLIIIVYYIDFSNFSGEPKHNFSQKPFWWSHKFFAYMQIIIKQTYCQNLRVENAVVLVLFKLLFKNSWTKLTILLIIIL